MWMNLNPKAAGTGNVKTFNDAATPNLFQIFLSDSLLVIWFSVQPV